MKARYIYFLILVFIGCCAAFHGLNAVEKDITADLKKLSLGSSPARSNRILKEVPKEIAELKAESDRLRIRQMVVDDINEVWVRDFCSPDPTDPMAPKEEEKFELPSAAEVQKVFSTQNERVAYGLFLKSDQKCVGRIGLMRGEFLYDALELTIWLVPAYRGKGLGTEGERSFISGIKEVVKAKPDMGLLYLDESINTTNPTSLAVARKLGWKEFHVKKKAPVKVYFYHPLLDGVDSPTELPFEETRDGRYAAMAASESAVAEAAPAAKPLDAD